MRKIDYINNEKKYQFGWIYTKQLQYLLKERMKEEIDELSDKQINN